MLDKKNPLSILNNHRKTLKQIVKDIAFGHLFGNVDLPITNIQFDSRKVVKNSLFCALNGLHVNGHDYIDDAIKAGATAILCEPSFAFTEKELSQVGVFTMKQSYIRNALAEISEVFYDYPADGLKIIGVTGTDGKSTTVNFIHQLLTTLGIKTGFISTVEYFDGEFYYPNMLRQSTPESSQIYEALYNMKQKNCSVAIIEATSHGLSDKTARMHRIFFDIGVVTNIGQEHLDFHGSVEQYVLDKSNLFAKLQPHGTGLIRSEEPNISMFGANIKKSGARMLTYSLSDMKAQYIIKNLVSDIRRIEGTAGFTGNRLFEPVEAPFYIRCTGQYNAENALAAIAAVHALDFEFTEITKHTNKLVPPKGRMQVVRNDLKILPLIDYAHTPGSFEKIFPMIKDMTVGKLIVVFGSAGERDTEKRPLQGGIADTYADIIVLTNEDPRGEDELAIIQDIGNACTNHILDDTLFYIPERTKAIHHALSYANEGDTVLFLGKGHEKSIILKDQTISWDEELVINKTIDELLSLNNW